VEPVPPSPRSSTRSILAHAALVASTVALTLLAAEVVLRLFPTLSAVKYTPAEKALFTRYDPELGWAPRPSMSGVHRDDGFSVFVSQNAWGLRAPEDAGPQRLQTGRRRMLVLGDSYVWGYGAAQDELFTDPHLDGGDVELVNFGVSGYGTDQELLLYRRLGVEFDVDEVIVVFTPYNDVANNLASEQYGYAKPYFVLEADGGLSLHRDHLRESRWDALAVGLLAGSSVVNLLVGAALRVQNVLLDRFAVPLDAAEARNHVLTAADVDAHDRAGLALTEALLRALRDEARAHGAAFSVVFVPYKPHILTGDPENHPFVPLLAAALTGDGIPYYEPYLLFLRESQTGPPLFNALDNHFSAAGHRLFARVFTDPAVRSQVRNFYAPDHNPLTLRATPKIPRPGCKAVANCPAIRRSG
jgi:lysophospholipase L1-like esterase